MENQHRQISGYRELDQEEIDLMNVLKHEAKELRGLHDRIAEMIDKRSAEHGTGDSEPRRWLAIGRTQYQQAIMALTRAVAAPDFE